MLFSPWKKHFEQHPSDFSAALLLAAAAQGPKSPKHFGGRLRLLRSFPDQAQSKFPLIRQAALTASSFSAPQKPPQPPTTQRTAQGAPLRGCGPGSNPQSTRSWIKAGGSIHPSLPSFQQCQDPAQPQDLPAPRAPPATLSSSMRMEQGADGCC